MFFALAASLAGQEPAGCRLEAVAGGGSSFSGDGGPAALAELDHPGDAVARPDGSIYVTDTGNGRVRWISPDGSITTVLQTPEPARIAVSPEGDLFVFDRAKRRIIRRMSNGFVRTVLADQGLGEDVGLDAGPGPTLYLADADNHRLLRMDRTGRLTTVAGDGTAGASGDRGPAELARLDGPTDVALGPDGSLFVAESAGGRIRRIWPDGRVETLEVGPLSVSIGDFASFVLGVPGRLTFTFEPPYRRIAVNADGEVAWTATGTGIPGLILGLPLEAGEEPFGLVTAAYRLLPGSAVVRVRGPDIGPRGSIDWMPDGDLLLGSQSLDQLFALGAKDAVEVLAGVGAVGVSGDGGAATQARLRAPQSVAALSTGEIFIADEDRVRVVRPNGMIEAADATLPQAYLASDAMDNLFVSGEEELLRRTSGGAVETLALASDCTDCLGTDFLLTPGPFAFGRIAAAQDDVWVQGRSTSSRLVRVTDGGEILAGPLRPLPFRFAAFLLDPYSGRLGADVRGGLLLATVGLLYVLGPESDEWQQIPGSAGFTRGDVQHSLRTEAGDVYFTLEERVLRLTPEGTLNTVAQLEAPSALALTADGDLLIADTEAGLVFRLREPESCDRTVRPQIYSGGVSNAAGQDGLYPGFSVSGVVLPAARVAERAPFAPGMIASVFGVRLAAGEAVAYDRGASSVPTELAGVSATAGGKPVGIAFASEGQLNLVLPFDLAESGEVDLVVTVDGVASEPFQLAMGPSSPGVFAVVNADGSINSEERPAKAGEEVSLLVSGLGRPEVEVDALAISNDVIPWPTEDLAVGLQPADADAEQLIVQPLWARSRPGEIASLAEVRFRIPEGEYLSPNGTNAALVRGDLVTLFDLYIE